MIFSAFVVKIALSAGMRSLIHLKSYSGRQQQLESLRVQILSISHFEKLSFISKQVLNLVKIARAFRRISSRPGGVGVVSSACGLYSSAFRDCYPSQRRIICYCARI